MPTPALKIARGFSLPLDLVTEATAIVATRGAGKSSASAVLVEEGFAAGVQSVIFDRTGVYWGLRSNADGDGPGLPIYVLGGPHGDVPLEAHAGKLIADLVVDSGHSFVLDLSDFSKGAAIKFAADFLEHLYDRKARARTTTLVVMDEAHFYAPQTPRGGFKGDAARLMGAMEDMVGLGRSRGLGVVLTTQRTQALNKAVLDMIETLLVMRMLSPRARTAVKEWIQEKHEEDERGVIPTLDSLPTGTAWVWSPLRGILEKVALRRIKTFDSYETPKPGQARVEPTARRELDLNALGEQIAATVEKAKENDPAELRKRVRELERQLAERPTEKQVVVEKEVRVEVPALTDKQVERLATVPPAIHREVEMVEKAVARLSAHVERQIAPIRRSFEKAALDLERERERLWTPEKSPNTPERKLWDPESPPPPPPPPAKPAKPTYVYSDGTPANGEIGGAARHFLETLVRHHPMRMTVGQLGVLARRKTRGGSFNTAMKELREGGYVNEDGGSLVPTEHAFELIGQPPAPLTDDQVIEQWRSVLPVAAREVLDVLVERHPSWVTIQEVGEYAGRQTRGGSWNTAISVLSQSGIIDKGPGALRASDMLFPKTMVAP